MRRSRYTWFFPSSQDPFPRDLVNGGRRCPAAPDCVGGYISSRNTRVYRLYKSKSGALALADSDIRRFCRPPACGGVDLYESPWHRMRPAGKGSWRRNRINDGIGAFAEFMPAPPVAMITRPLRKRGSPWWPDSAPRSLGKCLYRLG